MDRHAWFVAALVVACACVLPCDAEATLTASRIYPASFLSTAVPYANVEGTVSADRVDASTPLVIIVLIIVRSYYCVVKVAIV